MCTWVREASYCSWESTLQRLVEGKRSLVIAVHSENKEVVSISSHCFPFPYICSCS